MKQRVSVIALAACFLCNHVAFGQKLNNVEGDENYTLTFAFWKKRIP